MAKSGYPAGFVQDKIKEARNLHQKGHIAQAKVLYEEILQVQPGNPDMLHLLGLIAAQTRNFRHAVDLIEKAIQIRPDHAVYYCTRGKALKELGQLKDALASFDRAIAIKPDYAEAYFNCGVILNEMKQPVVALSCFERVIAIKPDHAEALFHRGFTLHMLKQPAAAIASYDRAIAIQPDYADAYVNRGVVLKELKQFDAAIASFDQAIAIRPDFAEAHSNRGLAQNERKHWGPALDSFDQAIVIKPNYAEAYSNRGIALYGLRQTDAALASFDRAIALVPDYAEAYSNRGLVLCELKQLESARASLKEAIALKPDYAEAYVNLGLVLKKQGKSDAALASFDRAIAIKSDYAEAHFNRGSILDDMAQLDAALDSYEQAMIHKPDCEFLFGTWLHMKHRLCDWQNHGETLHNFQEQILLGKSITPAFPVLALFDVPDLQRLAAEISVNAQHLPENTLGSLNRKCRNDKIRIGYYSADFHNHATAFLMAGMFESHDSSRFELIGFSFGPDKHDEMRQRIAPVFSRFIDVRNMSDREIAMRSRELGIDIAIDLKGYTQDMRVGIFAERCAPIQVNYLGYPGTMGAPFIDYIIADRVLIPEEAQQHYTEKIVYLPNSYQVNDARREISGRIFTREECGLPEEGFIYCCFNNNFKIMPEMFETWMRVLKNVPGSYLWLLEDNPTAVKNLRKEAERRGVNENRLIFAKRIPLPEHLSRHRLADVFLDTLPYNAHTTASDALWAGLPVLTCIGTSFAGRVAASLLNAMGLQELIAQTRQQYETKAIELATEPGMLAAIRKKLAQNRLTTPLFDTKLFTQNLESAYTAMYERYLADLPPENIEIF